LFEMTGGWIKGLKKRGEPRKKPGGGEKAKKKLETVRKKTRLERGKGFYQKGKGVRRRRGKPTPRNQTENEQNVKGASFG